MFPFNSVSDFSIIITYEEELLRQKIKNFVKNELENRIKQIEDTGSIPDELFRIAAKHGLSGLGIPRELGGEGGGHLSLTICIEEISKVCPSFATAIMVQRLFTIPVILYGTEQQKTKYIPAIARGEKFAAHGVTELVAGSDISSIKTQAIKEGDGWIINGKKHFITLADKADYFIILARTSEPQESESRWRGLTMFILEKTVKGLEVGRKIKITGMKGAEPCELFLNDVWVPDDSVLGKIGEGFKIAVNTYNYGRLYVAAQAVGISQAALEKCLHYTHEREAFEQPLISFQSIQFSIVDMLKSVVTARLITYWAAYLLEQGKESGIIAAALAKLYATEIAENVALKAIEIHGGRGVSIDEMIERSLRDSQVAKIYEGTPAILRLTVIRQLLKQILKDSQINTL
ncbi:MAG: acyl-CoA dehydrogenase family protein [Nitrososphaerota archaeon]